MKILYLVDKYPQSRQPKKGKYPAIFHAMAERGHEVCMIAHSALLREGNTIKNFKSQKVTDQHGDKSFVIEDYSQRFLMKYLYPLKFILGERKLETHLSNFAIRGGYNACIYYIEKYGLPDIVHAWGERDLIAATIAVRLKEEFGIPFVLNVHGTCLYHFSEFKHLEGRMINILKRCDCLLPVSMPLGKQWEATFQNNINYDWQVVHNPVDYEIFQLPENCVTKSRVINVFHISKLNENKDIPTLIKAFALAFNEKEAYLTLAGKSKIPANIDKLITQLNIQDKIKFIGSLTQEQVANEMKKTDIYALTSKIETFGIPIAEAMMSGKPVVTTKSGGPESYITSEIGEVVLPEDPVAFSQALIKVADNIEKYDPLYIRDIAIKLFGMHNVCLKMENIYHSILEKNEAEDGPLFNRRNCI